MLGICQNVLNIVLGRPEVVVPYNITIEPIHEYDQAFAIFDSHLEKYDIVMLDDLWLRPFESRLRTLSTLDSFQDHFKKKPFEEVFLQSLTAVCTNDDGVFAIPVSGNVQLLMYQQDLLKAAGSSSGHLPLGNPDELLDFLLTDRAKAAADLPFIVRYATDNDLAENFWEILRAYGYEESTANGEVLIPARLAQKALHWIQKAHPNGKSDSLGWKAIRSFAGGQEKQAMMMFGWPVWVMPDLIRNPESWRSPGMKKFIRHPITGFWSFAIPETSKYPEEAMKLILAVTTVPELQLLMGEAGLVPVLREFPESLLKERHPAWKENLDTIRDALASGKPRPRSMRWRDIEKELARQIRNGEFASREGLFRFVDDTKAHVAYPSAFSL